MTTVSLATGWRVYRASVEIARSDKPRFETIVAMLSRTRAWSFLLTLISEHKRIENRAIRKKVRNNPYVGRMVNVISFLSFYYVSSCDPFSLM